MSMQKYTCYYSNDFGDDYDALARCDADGDWYRVEDVDARIAELEQQLAGANASIALFMGPDGEQHIDRFADAVRSLMESQS